MEKNVNQYGEISESFIWDNKEIQSITPSTSFETSNEILKIYPCSEVDSYVEVKKIIISENKFWKSVKNQFKDSNNLVEKDAYSYITLSDGKTIGYLKNDKETAYTVTTTLPSAYVDLVLKVLCNTST